MIGTTLERSKTARESKVRALAFLLTLSLIVHGTFYAQEWLLLGAGLTFLAALSVQRSWGWRFSFTDALFAGMILLSLGGLINPVRSSEGWLDGVRWLTLWIGYRVIVAFHEEQKRYILRWIEGLTVLMAVVGWIPTLGRFLPQFLPQLLPEVDGRLAVFFGYPNALAAYFGAVLLLRPRTAVVRILIFLALLNTGSRAALVIFLIIWLGREALLWQTKKRSSLNPGMRNLWSLLILKDKLKDHIRFRLTKQSTFLLLILTSGILLTLLWNQQVTAHLLNWGMTPSLGERLLYLRDGIELAAQNKGLPRAGGWYAFPLVQDIPYWTQDPHCLGMRILLHQGMPGIILVVLWGGRVLWSLGKKALKAHPAYISYWLHPEKQKRDRRGLPAQNHGLSALLFLSLHALVDTDFLFGSLGILFWILFGIFAAPMLSDWSWQKSQGKRKFSPMAQLLLLGLGGVVLALAVQPAWLGKGDPGSLIERQEAARIEVVNKGSQGLAAVEDVLAWEKFNLRAYEWAQGVVFEEAEKLQVSEPAEARELYQWVEKVPERIAALHNIGDFEKSLWSGAAEFQPSEHNLLLAEYARMRQITLH